jgi:parallel beta-helix repeat protein
LINEFASLRATSMKRRAVFGRRLRFEALEGRQMMATFLVDDDFAADDPAARRFNTIQEAVNAAAAGDTVKVGPGTYEESVLVNKQLTIKGADPRLSRYLNPTKASIVDPPANNTDNDHAVGFNLQANGIVIKGFTIGEFDGVVDDEGTIGIQTSPSFSGYKIEDNVIEDNTIGIRLNTATTLTNTGAPQETEVEDNVIRDNDRAGSSQGHGIISDLGLQNVEIDDNEFTGAHRVAAISIDFVPQEPSTTLRSNVRITDNELEDLSGGGIYFAKVLDSLIEDNEIEDLARFGIQLNGLNQRVTIEDNDVEDVGTAGFAGIILSDENDIGANQNNIIEDNEIEDAGLSGLVIRDSSSNTIEDNEIKRSRVFGTTDVTRGNGISLQNADNNIIRDNEVKRNARNGIFTDANSTGNSLVENKSKNNNTSGATDAFDYNDLSTGGTGPSGSQNTYQGNKGRTQNKTGLIQRFV